MIALLLQISRYFKDTVFFSHDKLSNKNNIQKIKTGTAQILISRT
jgi:hypothetical protein